MTHRVYLNRHGKPIAIRYAGIEDDAAPLTITAACEDCGRVLSKRVYAWGPPPSAATIDAHARTDGHLANDHRCARIA